jgi:hypothetical protein
MIASGFPMRTELNECYINDSIIRRCLNLTKASNGNGAHGQWLTGVRVAFDLTCTNKMWVEAERYRFLEFVSSQSTMHRITKFNLDEQYCEYTDPRVIEIMKEKVTAYNKLVENKPSPDAAPELLKNYSKLLKDKYLEILYTNPSGFELTARMTTNYRCLLNIYIQRHDHRLPEWREFCEYLLNNLPYFRDFVEAYYAGKAVVD